MIDYLKSMKARKSEELYLQLKRGIRKKYWELIEKMDDTIVSNTNLLGDEEDTSLKVLTN
jgi:hypothetical protein